MLIDVNNCAFKTTTGSKQKKSSTATVRVLSKMCL